MQAFLWPLNLCLLTSNLTPKCTMLAFLFLLPRVPKTSFKKPLENPWWCNIFNCYFYNRLRILDISFWPGKKWYHLRRSTNDCVHCNSTVLKKYYFISGGCGLCFCRCRKILAGICSCSNCTWRRKSGPWYSTAWPSNFSSISPLYPEREGQSCRYMRNTCSHQHSRYTGKNSYWHCQNYSYAGKTWDCKICRYAHKR